MYRPEAKITATTSNVRVDDSWGYTALTFGSGLGSPNPYGIAFSRITYLPFGFTGTNCWVQTITQTIRRKQWASDSIWRKAIPISGLYSAYPYPYNDDTPNSPLNSTFIKATANDSFVMTLMFTPSGDATNVPLRTVDWDWHGAASPDTNSPVGWVLDPGSGGNSTNPVDYPTLAYPRWTNIVTSDSTYVPE
jgi:hypothetical protein